jgi:hypothetical protein
MTDFYPPYIAAVAYGDATDNHSGSGDFYANVGHREDANSGLVSTWTENSIQNAGDSARQVTYAYSGIQFPFQMPTSGRLNAEITLSCEYNGFNTGYLRDEWGWSSAAITQGANLNIWLPSGSDGDSITHNMLYYTRGEDEGTWSSVFARQSEVRTYNFISQKGFNSGDWVLLIAEIDSFQDVYVNDMSNRSSLVHYWRIVKLSITGVP